MRVYINEKIELVILEILRSNDCFSRISQGGLTGLALRFIMLVLIPWISGCAQADGSFQTRLRSKPSNEHLTKPSCLCCRIDRGFAAYRWFPRKTPSGLSIGTIWKTMWSRSNRAIGWSLMMNSMKPWQTNDDGVSPGWTRAVIITTFFRFPLTNKDGWATVKRSNRRFC